MKHFIIDLKRNFFETIIPGLEKKKVISSLTHEKCHLCFQKMCKAKLKPLKKLKDFHVSQFLVT